MNVKENALFARGNKWFGENVEETNRLNGENWLGNGVFGGIFEWNGGEWEKVGAQNPTFKNMEDC